ncbi:MAG TPA: hypothetical protein PLS49_08405, partial [Candidatus Woesebacteria bacterium]|nr:hypothetical protein [Candidatus Woesebacteria bacterium]
MNKIVDFIKGLNELSKIILTAVIIFLATSVVNGINRKSAIDEYNDSVAVVLQQKDSVEKIMAARADSLKQDSIKAVRQSREINRLRNNLSNTQAEKDRLQREIDSLAKISPDTHPASLKKDTLIAELRKDSTVMDSTIKVLEKRDSIRVQTIAIISRDRDDALGRAERAEHQLENLPNPPEDPDKWFFGLFNKPTRTQVGVGGVINNWPHCWRQIMSDNLKNIIKQEFTKCSMSVQYFLSKYCYIQHPIRGKTLFIPYKYQADSLKEFTEHDYNIVLKGRQLGFSTLVAGYALWLMLFHKDKNILVIATKQDTAKNLVTKVRYMHANLPVWLRGTCVEDNKLSMRFANGSQIKAVARSKDAGRSEALSLLILDEAAFI